MAFHHNINIGLHFDFHVLTHSAPVSEQHDIINSDTVNGDMVFSPPVKPTKERRGTNYRVITSVSSVHALWHPAGQPLPQIKCDSVGNTVFVYSA